MATPIPATFFGMTVESPGYNYGYYGGPVEATPTIPFSVARSWDVWSPGNGQVEYLDWSDLNPSAGVYNWTALNSWIALNQANNAQMVYTFGNPPAWAGGITTNLAEFQAFVTAVVTQAHGAIKYWEGFNEFDVDGMSPALVAQLQQIIYNTVHTLDPGALVLSPTVCAPGDDPLFAQFLADGGGKYFDIAAFHGYNNSTGEGIIPVVQDFKAVLSQYGLSNVPIWDTEWGMEAPTVITNTTAQEAYVSTGLILQAAIGVQTEIFYAYDNANTALYNTSTGKLTPAGVAYQVTEQWLSGATEPTGYQTNGSVYTVQLTKGAESDVLVWNAAGQSSYSAGSYTQYVDVLGQVHSIVNGTVNIGTTPILLETPVTTTSPAISAAPPAAPSIVSFSPDSGMVGDGITNAALLTLAGAAAAGSTVALFDGGKQIGTATANSSGAWTFTTGTLVNGGHSFTATDTDTAGYTSVASAAFAVTVDTIAPNAPVITSDTMVNTNEVTLAGAAEANSTVNVFDGTTELGTALANASGTWSYTTGHLSNGAHAFTATDTDLAGNTSLVSLVLDPTIGTVAAPAPPSIVLFSPDTGKVGDGITDVAVLTLTGAAEANSMVTVFDGKVQLGTAAVNSSGAWNFTTDTLVNGAHSFTTTDTDSAGTSTPSSVLAVTVDTVAPSPAFSNLVHNSNGAVTLSGTSEANSTISIYDGASTKPLGTVTTNANGTWNLTTAKLSNTVHSFTLKAVDVAGNTGAGSGVGYLGTTGNDTIKVGPSNDIVKGNGGADTFVFGTNLGKDIITDFQVSSRSHDVLQFSHNTFSSFAAVLAHAAQLGSDVVIAVDAADTVTLKNFHLSSLQKTDIHIV